MNDCLRTFNLTASGAITDTGSVAGSNVLFWTDYASKNTGFSVNLPLVNCDFSPQGFKNIDVYSIEVHGTIINLGSAGGNFICNDYSFIGIVTGNYPILSGVYGAGVPIALNQAGAPSNGFSFSKYHPKFEFISPIQSVTKIAFTALLFDGYVPTLIGATQELNFFYSFDVFVNYKFEGEEIAFL
jgi:hypothetical protein